MAFKQPGFTARANEGSAALKESDEKVGVNYNTFDHQTISTETLIHHGSSHDLGDRTSDSGRMQNPWVRSLLVLLAFLAIKVVTIKIFLMPHFHYAASPLPLASLAAPNEMSISSSRPSTSNTRETVIDLTSGSVIGSYHLYDLLSIHTTSGHIDITLNLENASDSDPKPALLDLSTSSGSIRIKTPAARIPSKIPDRKYRTSVSSASGSIDAELIQGMHTSLKTHSGRIFAELVPAGSNVSRSDISTHTNSGSTDITLHVSAFNASSPLRRLYSDYHHGSGELRVRYPSTWEGTLKGKTLSGGVDVRWDGMRIVRDKKGYVGREIEAVKGDGEGIFRFEGYSGSVTLRGDSDAWVDQLPLRGGRVNVVEPGVREGRPSQHEE